MKKEIIKTNNYLLVVDDSEIKVNDWYYLPRTNSAYRCQADPTELEMEKRFGVAKVIAHLPINDSADLKGVPLLPPLDVEYLAPKSLDYVESRLDYIHQVQGKEDLFPLVRTTWIDGYNKAKETYKFTEEDMINFACKVYNENYHKDDSFFTTAETLIKSFSQAKTSTPTHFDFEMEDGFSKNNDEYIDKLGAKGNYYTHLKVIKTTTNSQGQQVACGKYIY